MRQINLNIVEREVQKILSLNEFAEKIPDDKKKQFKIEKVEYYYGGEIHQHSSAWIKSYQSIVTELFYYANDEFERWTRTLESENSNKTCKILDVGVEITQTVRDTLNHYNEFADSKSYKEYFDWYFREFVINKLYSKEKKATNPENENPDVMKAGKIYARGKNTDRKLYHAYRNLLKDGLTFDEICNKLSNEFSSFHGKPDKIRLRITEYKNAFGTNMPFYASGNEEEASVERTLDDKQNESIIDRLDKEKINAQYLLAIDNYYMLKKSKSDVESKQKSMELISGVLTYDNYKNICLYKDYESLHFVDRKLFVALNEFDSLENSSIHLKDLAQRYGYSDPSTPKKRLSDFYKEFKRANPDFEKYLDPENSPDFSS